MMESSNLLDLCRCCLSETGTKSLSAPYTHQGRQEVYNAMLQDVFDIILSPIIQSSHSICETCVSALRNAAGFKRHVIACEERLKEYCSQFDVKKEEPNTFSNQAWCDVTFDNGLKEDRSGSDDDQPLAKFVDEELNKRRNIKKFIDTKLKQYVCDVCCKEFSYKGSLQIHLRAHRGEKTLPCLICRTKYCSHKELNRHMTKKHYDGEKYTCQICSENFVKLTNLKNHINEHFQDRFKCELCSKIFPRKKGLDSHLKSHSGEKKYTCNVCNKSFGHNQTLKVHMYVHTGEKPHVCHECGNSFTQSTHLKRHIFRIHRGIKKYACNICQKRFSSKTYMLTHERLHKGDKPFTCQLCQKDFTLYTSLKVHLKLHSGVKPYTCTHCNRNFAQMASLRHHERSHSGEKPFSCTVCKKFFSDNGYLKIHMRVHTGERPFECSTCRRNFREKGQLKRHMRTHTGEKYTCLTCNKQVSNLAKHMRVHVKPPTSAKSDIDVCKKEQW